MSVEGYGVWGLALAGMLAGVLIGFWTLKRIDKRLSTASAMHGPDGAPAGLGQDHDMAHRALMFMMTQRTDAMLAALAHAIENERRKLGVAVRNPSPESATQTAPMPDSANEPSPYEQIPPLATKGMTSDAIARRLRLPEDEVSMVLRVKAA